MSRIDTEQPMREALVDVVDFINKMDEDTAPAIRADLTNEIIERKAADIELEGKINTEAAERERTDTEIVGKIGIEADAREKADTELAGKITAEETARKSADGTLSDSIKSEVSARESADTELAGKISAEETARKSADGTLSDSIKSEVSARESADTELAGKITAVESNVASLENKFPIGTNDIADAAIDTNKLGFHVVNTTNIENSAVDVSKIKKNSISTEKIIDRAVTLWKLSQGCQDLLNIVQTIPDFAYGYSDSISLSSGESKTVTIPFNKTFTEVPQVFLTVMCNSGSGLFMYHLMYATTTQAVVSIKNGSSTAATNVTIDYLALAGR